jgi:hypothetical protein
MKFDVVGLKTRHYYECIEVIYLLSLLVDKSSSDHMKVQPHFVKFDMS